MTSMKPDRRRRRPRASPAAGLNTGRRLRPTSPLHPEAAGASVGVAVGEVVEAGGGERLGEQRVFAVAPAVVAADAEPAPGAVLRRGEGDVGDVGRAAV